MDDLEFGIRDVVFETKVLNRYNTFDQTVNRTMEDAGDVYLHYDLLDRVVLTTIILRVKSPHIEMYEHLSQKGMYVRVNFFGIESRSKQGFENCDIHIIIIIESTIIVSSISSFHPELVLMFLHTYSIRELLNYVQS
jgi:hypothetical protein